MKSSHIAFSALSAAVLLIALLSAGCTETETQPDLSSTGMVGTWQATLNIPKYENLTEVIYSFNSDGTGRAYYYHKWNEDVKAAVPFTWTIANSKANTFDIVYPTIRDKYPDIRSTDTFTLLDDKKTIYDGYDRYKKITADENLIVGTWKSVNPYHRSYGENYYDITYTIYENGTGLDAWYSNGNLTSSDTYIWDFLCINDDGKYVYYMKYPKYNSINVDEVLFLSPDGTLLEDRYNMTYKRE